MQGSEETKSVATGKDGAFVDTGLIWDEVSSRLESFVEAWEAHLAAPHQAQEPAIAQFLPSAEAPSRPFTLVELIKLDIERRWAEDLTRRPVAAYVAEFPEVVGDDGVPVDLLYEDIYIQQQHSDSVDVSEYLANYPDQADEVRRMIKLDKHEASTCLSHYCPKIEIGPGDKIDDFELLSRLGKGAFASVFLARQMSMQRIVAVKVSADRGREPQTLARLDHPNIVRIYDQRVLPDRGLRLLYMQYVPGGTLQDVLRMMQARHAPGEWNGKALLAAIDTRLEDQAVSIPQDSTNRRKLLGKRWHDVVCHTAQQLAEALHYAHKQGVLHRDIKPANILISDSASPKLVDFNISSCSKVEGASATAYFGGSLAYMSPEQMEACNPRHERTAESLTPASDVYALGVVIWEMIMGRRPFDDQVPDSGWSATLDALTAQRTRGLPESAWQDLGQKTPAGLVGVLRKCLAPDAADRFESAQHLADQLTLCLHPEAQRLLSRPTRWIPRSIERFPRIWLVTTMILPNALAGWLNYRFNKQTIIDPLQDAGGDFIKLAQVINAIAFPAGLVIGLWMVRKEAREVARRSREEPAESAPLEMRHRSLRYGRHLALLGIALWCIAGVFYPTMMRLIGHPLQGVDFFNFFISLFACGAIGAAYPYFGATAMMAEVWYPSLSRPGSISAEDVPVFRWVERISNRYLVMAASIPLLSLAVIILREDPVKPRLQAGLAIGGLILFGIVFRMWRRLQRDFGVLTDLVRTKDPTEF